MRVHIIGVPRNPSTQDIAVDPYARASYWLTTLLYEQGIEVYYYGYTSCTVQANKKFNVLDADFHAKYFTTQFENTQWTYSTEGDNIYSQLAVEQIKLNATSGDIVACMWSDSIKFALPLQENGIKVVDAHIGHHIYSEASYNVFTSVANQHFVYGKYGLENGRWGDVVIPPPCDSITEFVYSETKDNYYLFLARLVRPKGIDLFLDIAKELPNKKFILAGQGDLSLLQRSIPSNVEFVGYADLEKRKKLLSKAKAVISPTHYPEPFGLTTIEANLSGTPVITTSWGGYTDNVKQGVSGFRCTYFSEFIDAINKVELLDPKECRKFGEQFTAEESVKKYINYFNNISKSNWYEY